MKNMSLGEDFACNGSSVHQMDALQSFKTVGFSVIAIVGFVGNFILLISLVVDQKTRKVSYLLIWHLAFVDMLVCVLILPMNASQGYESLSELCDVYLVLSGIFPGISIYFQCYVSINRYCLTVKPMQFYQRWFSDKITRVTMVFMVAVNIAFVCAVYMVLPPTLQGTMVCGCFENHENQRNWVFKVLSGSSILIFLLGIYFYIKLLLYVRGSELTGISVIESQISKILAVLFIVYFISMILAPVMIYIAKGFAVGEWFIAGNHLLICINYAVNPIVYGLGVFKQTYIRTFARCFSSNKTTPIS